MSFDTLLKEAEKLSPKEKLQPVTYVWESYRLNPGEIKLTDEQRAELKRRREAYRNKPDDVLSWEEVKKQVLD
ncbi:MAG: addiction module protein [Planctomycetes bacterium]|nr:addiction module protein [Planctomycetota bacterium]